MFSCHLVRQERIVGFMGCRVKLDPDVSSGVITTENILLFFFPEEIIYMNVDGHVTLHLEC